jgi:hypothetical protein
VKLTVLFSLSGIVISLGAAVNAEAAVYCKSAGVPKGCIARPGAGAPGVGVAPGVGAGGTGVGVAPGVGPGAPGIGASPGVGVNRGGPVNRPGVR